MDNLLIRHFAKLLALKKIGNFFNRFFTIIKTKKPYMIVNILLINQNQSIVNFETQIQNPKLTVKLLYIKLDIKCNKV